MSSPVRVALVAEGPTDGIVIEAALNAIFGETPFILTQLQPEGSLAFGALGGGWCGVYRWCKQSAARGGGRLSDDEILFLTYDLLCLHLDADVSGKHYSDCSINPGLEDEKLPCERPCPPASASSDKLREVLVSWCGETTIPDRTVVCMPSKNMETWVLAAVFPEDQAVGEEIECLLDPEARFSQQPKRMRIKKSQVDYRNRAPVITSAWSRVAQVDTCGEAVRFDVDVRAAMIGRTP